MNIHLDENLKEILDSFKIGFWNWDIIKNEISFNFDAETIFEVDLTNFNYTFESYLENYVIENQREEFILNVNNALSSEDGIFDFTHQIITKNDLKWVTSRGKVKYNSEKNPISVIGLILDVSKAKLEELRREESEKRFSIITEHAGQLIYELNIESENIIWNGAVEEITGYSVKEFQAISLSGWAYQIHPDDREFVIKLLYETMASGLPFKAKYRFRKKNGDYLFIFDSGVYLKNNQGESIKMIGVMTDLSSLVTIQQTTEKYEKAFHTGPDASFIVDLDNDLLSETNILFDTFYNYSNNKLISNFPMWESEDVWKELKNILFTQGSIVNVETTLIDMDGVCHSVLISAQTLSFHNFYGAYFLINDISLYKKAQNNANQKEQTLKQLLQDIHVGLVIYDKDGKVIHFNEEAYELLGLTSEEFIAVHQNTIFWNFFDEDYNPISYEEFPIFTCMETLQPVTNMIVGIKRRRYKDSVWLLVNAEPQFDEQLELNQVLVTYYDISEHKNTQLIFKEAALEISAQQGEDFLENMVQKISTILGASSVNIIEILSLENKKGRIIHSSIPKDRLKIFYFDESPLLGAIENKECFYENNTFKYFSGYKFYEEKIEGYWAYSLKDSAGSILAIVEIISKYPLKKPEYIDSILKIYNIRLIAELERVKNDQLQENLIEQLQSRNKNLQDFSYIISHNLRAPIANLLGLSSLLNNTDLSSDQSLIIDKFQKVVRTLDSVIKDLNEALMSTDIDVTVYKKVYLDEIIQSIISSIDNEISKKNAEIHIHLDGFDQIYSIKAHIYNILFNLIHNSLKYSSADRKPIINIHTKIENDFAILTISDNGIGIDLQKHGHKIFGLYKRFHDHIDGKGMGLFLVKTQVESLGGKIEVSSTTDQGTTFTIKFRKLILENKEPSND